MNRKELLITILVISIAGMLWTPFIQLANGKPSSLFELSANENPCYQPLTDALANEYTNVPEPRSNSIADASPSQVPIPTAPTMATVETDKQIYLPSDTATIHGRDFAPLSTITLNITRPCCCGQHDSHLDTWNDLTTDISGNFVMDYQLSGATGFYNITATDEISLAENSFLVSSFVIWTDKFVYQPDEIATIYGAGFNANTQVNITIYAPNNINNTWLILTDASGNFTTTYLVEHGAGIYYILATDGTKTATTWFSDPSFYITPKYALPGETVVINGYGFYGSGEIEFGGTYVASFTSDEDGNFWASFEVPLWATPGEAYTIYVKSSYYFEIPFCIPWVCVKWICIQLLWWKICYWQIYPCIRCDVGLWLDFEGWRTFTVSIPDESPPTTSHEFDGTPGCGDWYTSEVQVSLDAQDDISGVAQTVFRIDDSPWVPYLGDPIPFTIQGEFKLEYNSTDNVGNVEQTKSVIVKIDWTEPVTTIDPVGTAGGVEWYTSYFTVTLTAEDPSPGSGVEYTKYRINGGAWETGTSFDLTVDGAYFIEYYSKDIACNTEGIKSTTIKIDTQAPTTGLTISPYYLDGFGTIYVTCDTTFTLSADDHIPGIDPVSGVYYIKYRINSGEWVTWTGPFEITGPVGTYIIEYYSVDIAGNVEQPPHSETVELVCLSVTSYLTDSDFNPISFFDFIVHYEKKSESYKLVATNPGQFYYNIEIRNTWPIAVDTLVITPTIPEHFVLKGANPIHVYLDGVDITELCTLENPSITVFNVPSGSQVYITIHLDYGLKQTYFDLLTDIPINQYIFSVTITGESGSIVIPGEGLFGTYGSLANLMPHQKKTTAIAGYVKDIDGTPIIGAVVELKDSEGNTVFSTETDVCGFYYFIDIDTGGYAITVTYNTSTYEHDGTVVALYQELTLVDIIINGS